MPHQFLVHFLSGITAGFSSCLINQPFDFIKTKNQTEKINQTSFYWAKNIYHEHGFFGFYKGSSSVLLGAAIITAFEFSLLQFSKKLVCKLTNSSFQKGVPEKYVFFPGAIVGLCTSVVYCPVEYTKLILQTQKKQLYKSSIQALFKIMFSSSIGKLYRGWTIVVLRDMPGSGLYFGCYDLALKKLNKRKQSSINYFLSGSLGGLIFWLYAYPYDAVKTKIQVGISFSESFKQCYQQKSFYRGSKIILLACLPVNATHFFVYENAKKLFTSLQ